MSSSKSRFLLIAIVTAISLYITLPSQTHLNFQLGSTKIDQILYKRPIDFYFLGKRIFFDPQIKFGLDLQGGTQLTLAANMQDILPEDRLTALESAREVISRRIDLFGVTEPVIQTSIDESSQSYRLIVELPGVSDVDQAVELIGQTAQLEFKTQDESLLSPEATISGLLSLESFVSTGLTGKDLQKAQVQFDPQSGQPVVALNFTDEGAEKFAQITEANINKPVGIFLDDLPLTIPRVNQVITDGQAIITGQFSQAEAKNMTIQLNAGALPVPIEVIAQSNIGATLGQISVQQSLVAGAVGLTMVMIFMALYYGYQGLLADFALIIYALITLALYKILGVTITLPGLAGFILSVGMAVDSNILIFERTKEELRSGKQAATAIELGFGRAWDSIKDANVATLMITFILFNPFNWNFLNTSGMVRGFALTLALGILISLFTGIVVTRTFIRLFYHPKTRH